MDSYIFGFFALAYLIVLIWGLMKHQKTASAVLFLVVIALIYDNAVLAMGNLLGKGHLLEFLSYGRFWLHGLFTPMLILFSLFVMRESGISFTRKKWATYLFGLFWLVALVVEYKVNLRGLKLSPQEAYGVLSYTSLHEASGPPLMILLVLVALFIAAIAFVWKKKWWWMLVGAIVMTIGSAVPVEVNSNSLINAFELFLIVTLMLTAIHFSQKTKNRN